MANEDGTPDRSDRERAHVLIAGRVQGVGFRQATRRRAKQLELAGWVRNLPDGRVEALFEGPAAAVEAALAFARTGPGWTEVDAVELVARGAPGSDEPPLPHPFEIRR